MENCSRGELSFGPFSQEQAKQDPGNRKRPVGRETWVIAAGRQASVHGNGKGLRGYGQASHGADHGSRDGEKTACAGLTKGVTQGPQWHPHATLTFKLT